jgi:hypothetical protein
MLPGRLSGVAGWCEQPAGTKERRRRASRDIVAEEGQRVHGNGAADRDEGGTDPGNLLAMRRASYRCMHALTVRQIQSHEAPPRRQPELSSWAPLVSSAGWMLLATKRCVPGGGRGEDAMV